MKLLLDANAKKLSQDAKETTLHTIVVLPFSQNLLSL